ncbi:hypothetical protein TNCV_5112561 [Trichonephila clavipes]|nr:hypothetical protein TNCV_5112561 [Trichonephila clavipes]
MFKSHRDLVWDDSEQFSIQSELKSATLSTIHCRYPIDKWLHVYADDSAEDTIKNVGAGAHSSALSISYLFGNYCDNFGRDIAIISFAVDKLESCSGHNIVFFIDS